jgi:hypothetical protein
VLLARLLVAAAGAGGPLLSAAAWCAAPTPPTPHTPHPAPQNFFDAGSCIDGRLTSAWHWCSQLHKKPFFPLVKLAGFVGFDGDFK